MKIFLPEIRREDGSLDLSNLPTTEKTCFISVMGQDGSGKTSLRDNLAEYCSSLGKTVVTAKSPCDKYIVGLLNNAISQNGYDDWYTEQLLFSFCDGLLSNYMIQLKNHCDYFICQRGPCDQYDHGVTRSGKTYQEIHDIQRPERLAKFDTYIHMNCDAKVAWDRICEDEGKDRYEYPEYFERETKNTEKLFKDITEGDDPALDFLRDAKHFYICTTEMTIDEVFKKAQVLLHL
jgi:thymidylate kinase